MYSWQVLPKLVKHVDGVVTNVNRKFRTISRLFLWWWMNKEESSGTFYSVGILGRIQH